MLIAFRYVTGTNDDDEEIWGWDYIEKLYYKDIPVARVVRQGETVWTEPIKLSGHPKLSEIYPDTYSTIQNICAIYDAYNVTDLSEMYKGCSKLTAIPEMQGTYGVESFKGFAQDCVSLKDVPKFSTSGGKDFSYMFAGCTSLPEVFPWTIQLDSIDSPASIKDIFANSSVKEVTFSRKATGNISYQDLKENCNDLVIHSVLKWDPEVRKRHKGLGTAYLDVLYPNPKKMTQIPETIDFSEADSAEALFCYMENLTEIPKLLNLENVKNIDSMFSGCKNIRTVKLPPRMPNLKFNYNTTTKYGDNYTPIKVTHANISAVFQGCNSLEEIILPELQPGKYMYNAEALFDRCYNLKKIVNMPKSASISRAFNYCENLEIAPEIEKTDDISLAFGGCKKLKEIPPIDTSESMNFFQTFYGCESLPKIFPWKISLKSVAARESCLSGMFGASSVTKVTFTDVRDEMRPFLTSKNLKGDDTLTINIE